MGTLIIEDLKEDKKLDETAMKAVAGGSAGAALVLDARGRRQLRDAGLEESRLIRGLLKSRSLAD